MVFEDFGRISERRESERKQKLKKRLAVAAVTSIVLGVVISSALVAVYYRSKHANDAAGDSSSDSLPAVLDSSTQLVSTSKAVAAMCAPTDYKLACERSLSKAVNGSDSATPKDLVTAAVAVIMEEVDKAINRSSELNSTDPRTLAAVRDCRELLGYAMDDLKATISTIDGNNIESLPSVANDLKTWLSATITYQENCVDGFPAGKTKRNMRAALTDAKQLNSNALAIVDEVVSLFQMLESGSDIINRKLEESYDVDYDTVMDDEDGPPVWMTEYDRRQLKEHTKAGNLKPNVVVAKDGSGQYKTINQALSNLPKERNERYVIYIKEGVYKETVVVEKTMVNVTMYGDGSRKTIITGDKSFVDGVQIFKTATFAAIGDGFIAEAIGFQNTAGAIKHQAVALRVQSDRSIFLNCRIEGYQDTLYAQTHRQFYRGCVIAGTVDFIFGDAAAVIQNSEIILRKPLDYQENTITAQTRTDRRESTGIVIHNCRILADEDLNPVKNKFKSYLGRPGKEHARTIVMESEIDDLIQPVGWVELDGEFGLETLTYGEYKNKGAGAGLVNRVKLPGYTMLKKEEADEYTVAKFIQGGEWIKATGTPVRLGLYNTI